MAPSLNAGWRAWRRHLVGSRVRAGGART